MVAINDEIKQRDQVEMEQLYQLQGTKSLLGVDSMEELVQVRILPYTNKYFLIRKSLQVEDRVEVLLSLIQNLDVFAWNPYKVPGVDLTFITNRLNVDPLVTPKKRKPRRSTKLHMEVVKVEVKKLK